MKRIRGWLWIAAALALGGCGPFGRVEQGRVIAYDRQTQRVTLIRTPVSSEPSAGILPPVTIAAPEDAGEMGPAPAAGRLMLIDSKARSMVIYDLASQSFRTIVYSPVAERRNVKKDPGAPVIDRVKKTITVYSPEERSLITFAAPGELLALPADTWSKGDVVRYYYKEPGRAIRLMNVTRTDLSKSSS